ncbi:MAG: NADH-quinone oxidoreductase subunit L [Candidatus Omnitrophica bacterium]|nr:NADH-quinone oxidoreductase subunit L [Candidatus Omnitrophota bacterium]
MPSLLIFIPLFGIVILNLPFGKAMRNAAFWFALAVFIVQIVLAITHQPIFWGNEIEQMDAFFRVNFSVDQLSFVMLLCIGLVSLTSLLVMRDTIFDINERFKFINLLMLASMGMSGIVMVTDIFTMYIFLEITAIASFILIAFEKDVYALEGAFKYMVLSALASVLILAATAILLLGAGSASFTAIADAIHRTDNNLIAVAMGLFVCGLLIKGGMVPFHGWLPDAYGAASPAVSVLLAGIVTKAAGIYTLIRALNSILGFDANIKALLLALGTISILVGAFAAIGQKDFKRMLAYSSISQTGYIVLGFGCATPLAIAGAVFHLFNHSIFKSLLFVNSAAVETRLGSTDMDRAGGLAQKMPITGFTSVIGALSAAGIPPLSGFWSKIIIVVALWQAGHTWYAATAIMASIITLAYLLAMQRKVFFGKLALGLEDIEEARLGIRAASVMLAAIIIGFGVLFPSAYAIFIAPIGEMFIK